MYIFSTFLHKFDFSNKINANFDEAFLFLVSLVPDHNSITFKILDRDNEPSSFQELLMNSTNRV